MSIKGSQLKHGHRDHIFGKSFFKEFKKNHPKFSLTYKESSDIIRKANSIIADIIKEENDGFKLPNQSGYICVNKYKPTKDNINWKESNKIGKHVYYLNLNTMGYACRIQWFRIERPRYSAIHDVFKFVAWSSLSSDVSKLFANGKPYSEFIPRDFIERGKLEKVYNKHYKNK